MNLRWIHSIWKSGHFFVYIFTTLHCNFFISCTRRSLTCLLFDSTDVTKDARWIQRVTNRKTHLMQDMRAGLVSCVWSGELLTDNKDWERKKHVAMASKVFPRWYGVKAGPQTPDVLDGVKIPTKSLKRSSALLENSKKSCCAHFQHVFILHRWWEEDVNRLKCKY